MRIIDADKLLDDMKKELEKAVNDENLDKDEYMVILTSAIALKDFTNRQPTAFDVEKVVETLKLNAYDMEICEEQFDMNRPYFKDVQYKMVKLGEAIDVIKRGGIDEDR